MRRWLDGAQLHELSFNLNLHAALSDPTSCCLFRLLLAPVRIPWPLKASRDSKQGQKMRQQLTQARHDGGFGQYGTLHLLSKHQHVRPVLAAQGSHQGVLGIDLQLPISNQLPQLQQLHPPLLCLRLRMICLQRPCELQVVLRVQVPKPREDHICWELSQVQLVTWGTSPTPVAVSQAQHWSGVRERRGRCIRRHLAQPTPSPGQLSWSIGGPLLTLHGCAASAQDKGVGLQAPIFGQPTRAPPHPRLRRIT
mmetsp:Transcript_94268/g.224449  ORF Transcript_94268/g.224449 Transcript_94268/m.224449 type:complete len:252 (-) Transcript_94268:1273-2028(-)